VQTWARRGQRSSALAARLGWVGAPAGGRCRRTIAGSPRGCLEQSGRAYASSLVRQAWWRLSSCSEAPAEGCCGGSNGVASCPVTSYRTCCSGGTGASWPILRSSLAPRNVTASSACCAIAPPCALEDGHVNGERDKLLFVGDSLAGLCDANCGIEDSEGLQPLSPAARKRPASETAFQILGKGPHADTQFVTTPCRSPTAHILGRSATSTK